MTLKISGDKLQVIKKSISIIVLLCMYACVCIYGGKWILTLNGDIYSKLYVITCVAIGIGVAVLYYFLFIRKQIEVHNLYLVLAIVLGFSFFTMMPEGETPDEFAHVNTTYSISNKLFGMQTSPTIELYESEANAFGTLATNYSRQGYNEYIERICHGTDRRIKNEGKVITAYAPIKTVNYVYFAQAVGVTIGRILNIGAQRTLLLGSIFSYIFFVICAYWAIRITPVGKEIFMCISILPMTLQQTTSYSYDTFIIAISFLVIAMFLKIWFSEKVRIREYVIVFLLAILLAPTKSGAYIFISVLILPFVFELRKKNKKIFATTVGVACALGLLFVIVIGKSIIYADASANANGFGYSLLQLLSDPIMLIQIIGNTFWFLGDFYYSSTIGGSLGWFQFGIPWYLVSTYFVILLAVSVGTTEGEVAINRKMKLIFVILALGCLAMCELAMLLFWTPDGYTHIEGVQGRYFLPFLPLLLLAIKSDRIKVDKLALKQLMIVPAVLQIIVIINLFSYCG